MEREGSNEMGRSNRRKIEVFTRKGDNVRVALKTKKTSERGRIREQRKELES